MQEGAGLQRLGKQALVVLRHLEVAQVLDVAFVRQRWVGQQEITQLMALPIQQGPGEQEYLHKVI